MRAGNVVTMRVSPADCMTAVDILNVSGQLFPGMSFASAVSLAMSVAFEELRRSGKVPKREGFEYASLMEPFAGSKKNTKGRRAFSDRMYNQAMQGIQPSLSGFVEEKALPQPNKEIRKWVIPPDYHSWPDEKKLAWQERMLDEDDRIRAEGG